MINEPSVIRRKNLMAATLFLLGIMGLSFVPAAQAIDDTILAVVDDEVITLRELRDYLNAYYTQLQLEGRSRDDIDRAMKDMETHGLNKLIEDRLILSEAEKRGLEINPEAIEARLKEIQSRYPSEEAFLKALVNDGATLSDLRNKIEEKMKIRYMMDEEVRNKIFVNPQDVTDYYKNHFEHFQKPESVEVNSIFISLEKHPDTAAERASRAMARIKAGEDFRKVAEEFSDMPSLGRISRGKLKPTLDRIIFSLNEGDVSEPVRLDNGFYIFQVVKKFPPSIQPLEKVKQEISQRIYHDKLRQRYDEWIHELKEDTYIEIKTDLALPKDATTSSL